MWTGIIPASELSRLSRWKVETFSSGSQRTATSLYPLVALRELMEERKEVIEPAAFPTQTFQYLGLENVQSLTGDLVGYTPRQGNEIRSRSKRFFAGDILYGRLRPYLNKVYLAEGIVSEGVCSGEFYVLVPRRKMALPRYLRWILASGFVQERVVSLQTGSALPRLQIHDLLTLPVPLPPVETQEMLVAFVEREDRRRLALLAELTRLPERIAAAFEASLTTGRTPSLELPQVSVFETPAIAKQTPS